MERHQLLCLRMRLALLVISLAPWACLCAVFLRILVIGGRRIARRNIVGLALIGLRIDLPIALRGIGSVTPVSMYRRLGRSHARLVRYEEAALWSESIRLSSLKEVAFLQSSAI